MVLFKYLLYLIVGIAPIAAIASLIGTFYGFGGWGWLLFLWFGFIGMFSMGAAKYFEKNKSDNETTSTLLSVGLSLLLISAFIGGALFALSNLPKEISVFYALLALFVLIPIFMLLNRESKNKAGKSNILQEFEKEINNWPQEQARTALLLIKATISGDQKMIDELYPELTVNQFKSVEQVMRKIESESLTKKSTWTK